MDITEKIWWIAINGKSEGAYSFLDLERDERVTPDTMVWKEGFSEWKKIRDIEELQQLFSDKKKEEAQDEEDASTLFPEDEELAYQGSVIPPWIFFWIIAIMVAIVYLWQIFRTS